MPNAAGRAHATAKVCALPLARALTSSRLLWRRELFGDRRVDERHSSTAGDVGPHGVAGGLLVELGFEPGGTAGPDDGVVEARSHLPRPDLERAVGELGQLQALAPCMRIGLAERDTQGLAAQSAGVESPRV